MASVNQVISSAKPANANVSVGPESWSRYVNEKIYLSRAQLEYFSTLQKESLRGEGQDGVGETNSTSGLQSRGAVLSCFWATVGHIYTAYRGVLSEIAYFHQKRITVNSLDELGEVIGSDAREFLRLIELSHKRDSWLWQLLSLQSCYESPSFRVGFDSTGFDVEDAASNAAIIAKSSPSNFSETFLKTDWNFSDFSPDLLDGITSGLSEYLKEIRMCAMEW